MVFGLGCVFFTNKGITDPNMKKKKSADMYYCNSVAGFSKKGAQ